jgi:uncharacterized membrane protein YjfL (UPF0719 family)
MKESHRFDYAGPDRVGHSPYAIASICMAAVVYLFIFEDTFFDITPFDSQGNVKEIKVAIAAAILGVLLGVRALQDTHRKRFMAQLGLALNALAIPAALVFLPCL